VQINLQVILVLVDLSLARKVIKLIEFLFLGDQNNLQNTKV
jgi:hypothetical protein